MDPFLEIVQAFLEQGGPLQDALAEVQPLWSDPVIEALFRELSSSGTGRELLADWQQEWKGLGIAPPWLPLVWATIRLRSSGTPPLSIAAQH